MSESKDVIWIASYPKSGNTWLHSVIRSAGENHGFPQSDLDVYNLIVKNEGFPICSCVSPDVTRNPCSVLKTHASYDPPTSSDIMSRFNTVGFIHIYRNPLDVLLSYLNYTRLEYPRRSNDTFFKEALFDRLLGLGRHVECEDWQKIELKDLPTDNLDHALDFFSDNQLNIETLSTMSGSWAENTISWLDATNKGKGISIRYEDCIADNNEFLKVVPFFSYGPDDVFYALALVKKDIENKRSNPADQENVIFYNKMERYYYRKFFSSGAISRFLTRNENILHRTGYKELLEMG